MNFEVRECARIFSARQRRKSANNDHDDHGGYLSARLNPNRGRLLAGTSCAHC